MSLSSTTLYTQYPLSTIPTNLRIALESFTVVNNFLRLQRYVKNQLTVKSFGCIDFVLQQNA